MKENGVIEIVNKKDAFTMCFQYPSVHLHAITSILQLTSCIALISCLEGPASAT